MNCRFAHIHDRRGYVNDNGWEREILQDAEVRWLQPWGRPDSTMEVISPTEALQTQDWTGKITWCQDYWNVHSVGCQNCELCPYLHDDTENLDAWPPWREFVLRRQEFTTKAVHLRREAEYKALRNMPRYAAGTALSLKGDPRASPGDDIVTNIQRLRRSKPDDARIDVTTISQSHRASLVATKDAAEVAPKNAAMDQMD